MNNYDNQELFRTFLKLLGSSISLTETLEGTEQALNLLKERESFVEDLDRSIPGIDLLYRDFYATILNYETHLNENLIMTYHARILKKINPAFCNSNNCDNFGIGHAYHLLKN